MKKRDNSVVAMLDLLGFSQIMESESLDEIERRYTRTLMSGLTFSGFASIGAFVFDDEGNLDSGEDLWAVSFGIFSDTVVIYPRPLVGQPIRVTCEAVASVIDVALQGDWLFRGGIDFGSFRALPDHNLYIGKALIGAYRLETMQNWAGAIVSEAAQNKYRREIAEMKEEHLLVEYPVPIKVDSGVVEKTCLAVNWCYFDMRWQHSRRDKLLSLLESAPTKAKAKVNATIEFHDKMVQNELASLKQIGGGRVIGDPTGGAA